MKERIIQFLSENNLTSTRFADVIGVQRSSISHILSGRNKPSFDFIEKMLVAYPDLNAQWLITGKENMFTNQHSLFTKDEDQTINNLTQRESNIQNLNDQSTDIADSEKEIETMLKTKLEDKHVQTSIERVMIFYSNGSFKEYKPD